MCQQHATFYILITIALHRSLRTIYVASNLVVWYTRAPKKETPKGSQLLLLNSFQEPNLSPYLTNYRMDQPKPVLMLLVIV